MVVEREEEKESDGLETYVPTGITIVKYSYEEDVLVLDWNIRKLMSINLLNDWWWKKYVTGEGNDGGGWKIISLMEWDKGIIRIHLSKFASYKSSQENP